MAGLSRCAPKGPDRFFFVFVFIVVFVDTGWTKTAKKTKAKCPWGGL